MKTVGMVLVWAKNKKAQSNIGPTAAKRGWKEWDCLNPKIRHKTEEHT